MKKFFIAVFFTASVLFAQSVIPIINLHQNDSNGSPVLLNQMVTVTGIVTASNQFGNSGPGAVQDETGGVAVYGSGFVNAVQIGDSVKLRAKVTLYNGLVELKFDALSTVTVYKHGVEVQPKVVTLKELAEQKWNDVEEFEGSLVRVNNVTISGSGYFDGGTSGRNYSISDSTGSLKMRIDESVNIVGTAIPSSPVDIIAIVAQYDPSAPYSSGYQILPRKIEDIITQPVPTILTPVVASDITPTSFTVYFTTLHKGNSEVKYGKTLNLEMGDIVVDEDTTFHSVKIDGLEPLTTYYYKVYSSNATGTSTSRTSSVTTASPNPETGKINVYFNFSVDHNVSIPGNEANGNVDFTSKIVNRINHATYSIDLALYSFFGITDIENALIAAKNRGVKIRLVYDNRTVQSSVNRLLDAGVKMSQRPQMDGIMHNKFAVFDARDDNPDNDWVWTGSWNWTSTELNWRNNAIEINDPSLARAYTEEFEEMWGSNTDEPNPANAKFGPYKTDNTPHSFSIKGRSVQLYFSPSDNTEDHLSDALRTADSSIYFAVLSFTSDPLYYAIENRYNAGVRDIRGIISDANTQGSEFSRLSALAPGEIFDFNLDGKLHDKYGMVDVSYPTSDPTVMTGSHNWSKSANTKNDENTLIIHDIYIANQYMQEFKKRYNELGGTTAFVVPKINGVPSHNLYPRSIVLNQNYPNPFGKTKLSEKEITTISFYMPMPKEATLTVSDVLGRTVKVLYKGRAKAGLNVFDFNAEGLASGVYFYSLKADGKIFVKKMLLLR